MRISSTPRIIYIYKTILVPGGGPTVGRAISPVPARIRNAMGMLNLMALRETDPVRKRQLEDILKALQALIVKIKAIPSAGIRDMLYGKVDEVMQAIGKGELNLAADLTAAATVLADKCSEACDQIKKNIHTLKAGLDVKGPAGALLRAIGEAAELAMNGASSLEGLEAIVALTDRAITIGKELEKVEPGTKEYAELMDKLSAILIALKSMPTRNDRDIAMAGDASELGETMGDRIETGMAQLRQKTTDAFALEKIGALEKLLGELDEVGRQGEGALGPEAAKEAIIAALKLAGEGKLDEAIALTVASRDRLVQMQGLGAHVDRRLSLLCREGQQLEGPAKEAFVALVEKLQLAQGACKTPEDAHRLDLMIEQALKATHGCGKGPSPRTAGLLELKRLERALAADPLLAAPGGPSPGAHVGPENPFGHDLWGPVAPGATAPAAPAGPASPSGPAAPAGPASPGGPGTSEGLIEPTNWAMIDIPRAPAAPGGRVAGTSPGLVEPTWPGGAAPEARKPRAASSAAATSAVSSRHEPEGDEDEEDPLLAGIIIPVVPEPAAKRR